MSGESGAGDEADPKLPFFTSDSLTEAIIAGMIRAHSALGSGFVESIDRRSLFLDLTKAGLDVVPEREIEVYYLGQRVGMHRLDLLVEKTVVLELKTVDRLAAAHYAQLRSCLKAAGLGVGLRVNFASSRADDRRAHPL